MANSYRSPDILSYLLRMRTENAYISQVITINLELLSITFPNQSNLLYELSRETCEGGMLSGPWDSPKTFLWGT